MKLDDNYVLDLNKIIDFCFNDEIEPDSEITELYVMDEEEKMSLSSKQVRELKNDDATSKQTMKYDLVKTLMVSLLSAQNDMTDGECIIKNTMLSAGFLKEIEK